MVELLRFEVRPIHGAAIAVNGEEVTFYSNEELKGKVLALNEDGEPFGVVPNKYATKLLELLGEGRKLSASVESRNDGIPCIVVYGEALVVHEKASDEAIASVKEAMSMNGDEFDAMSEKKLKTYITNLGEALGCADFNDVFDDLFATAIRICLSGQTFAKFKNRIVALQDQICSCCDGAERTTVEDPANETSGLEADTQIISDGEYSIELPVSWTVSEQVVDEEASYSIFTGFSPDCSLKFAFQPSIPISGMGGLNNVLEQCDAVFPNDDDEVGQSSTEEGAISCNYRYSTSEPDLYGDVYIILSRDTAAILVTSYEEYEDMLDSISNSLVATHPAEPDFTRTTYKGSAARVGKDIAPGEYKVTCSDDDKTGCCRVYSNIAKESIIDSEQYFESTYVTLSEGQFIDAKNVTFTSVNKAKATSGLSENDMSSMYKIGLDLKAGEYLISANQDETGYYCVYDSSDVANRNILINDTFEGNARVVVSEGQYLEISRATAEFAK